MLSRYHPAGTGQRVHGLRSAAGRLLNETVWSDTWLLSLLEVHHARAAPSDDYASTDHLRVSFRLRSYEYKDPSDVPDGILALHNCRRGKSRRNWKGDMCCRYQSTRSRPLYSPMRKVLGTCTTCGGNLPQQSNLDNILQAIDCREWSTNPSRASTLGAYPQDLSHPVCLDEV